MRRETIEERLVAIVRDELDHRGPLPRGSLAEDFDSIELMTLVVAVEDDFRIMLEPADEEAIDTVDDLVDVIVAKTAESDGEVGDGAHTG